MANTKPKADQSLFDKVCRNDKNQLVIWQPPNLPIYVWLAAGLLSRLLPGQQVLLSYIAFGALFTWAWLEIFQGDSYFRRILGVTILILALVSKI